MPGDPDQSQAQVNRRNRWLSDLFLLRGNDPIICALQAHSGQTI
jgi:hypothetical protein